MDKMPTWLTLALLKSGQYYCPRCDTVKGVAQFSQRRDRPSKLAGRCKACCKEVADTKKYGRRWDLRTKYPGLSDEQIEDFIENPKGPCAICGVVGLLCVDHDHATKVVRERLCHSCNLGLGLAGDSASRLEALAVYLRKHNVKDPYA